MLDVLSEYFPTMVFIVVRLTMMMLERWMRRSQQPTRCRQCDKGNR